MKRIYSILAAVVVLLTCMSRETYAQTGATCDDAIYVDGEYTANFAAGEYWFMALTSALPMTIKCYPSNPGAKAPQIQVDFTCTYENGKAVYDDPKVAKMVMNAAQYELTLPMTKTLTMQMDDNGKPYYSYTFPKNYQNMLYGQGVTYAIPAYVKLKVFGTTSAEIVSEAVSSRCRDYVNTLGMNTTLLISPEDSVNTYVWPLGEWLKHNYEMTWTGTGRLFFYTSKDCEFDKESAKVRDIFILPNDQVKITSAKASDWIDDIFQTELYVRMYPESEGYFKIATYEEKDNITQYVVGGVPASIDNENMTISAILPAGTDRNAAIAKAQYRPTKTHDGQTAEYNSSYTKLTFGKLVYDLTGIVVAQKAGDTNAALKSISVEGLDLPDFSRYTLNYFDIEVAEGKIPTVAATPVKETSAVDIKQATAVPGTATITITAEAGNTQVYTVSFIRQRSRDNTLSALYVDGKLVEGFQRDNYHYRMQVMSLPTITATLNDPKATMVIDQPKRVPGFGQVIVTAESGQVEVYTVNFVLDPAVKQCSNTVEQMNASQTYTLNAGNTIMRVPVSEWGGKNAVFTWTGQQDLDIDVMSTCLNEDGVTFANLDVTMHKGESVRHCYLSTTQTLTWRRQGIDGYVYLLFKPKETAEVSIAPFAPTCYTRSTLIDLPSQNQLPANGFNISYSFYLPEWQKKDVKITWTGASTLELFIADTCDFLLQQTNTHLLAEGYKVLSPGQSFVITQGVAQGWLQRVGDMAYMRVLNGAQGTLSFTIEKDYSGGTPPVDTTEHKLTLLSSPADAGTFKAAVSGEELSAGDGTGVFSFEENKTVSFAAVANEHYTFRSWADGNAQNPRTVNMNTDKEYTALFVVNKYTLTVTCNQQQGRVSGSGRYNYLTEVPVEARANRGYRFSSWSDGSTDNPHTITIEGDTEIEALFVVDDTAVDDLSNDPAATDRPRKVVRDNQLLILMPDGTVMNMLGERVQ